MLHRTLLAIAVVVLSAVTAGAQTASPAPSPAAEPAVISTTTTQPDAALSASPEETPSATLAKDPDFRTALAAATPVLPAAYSTEPFRLRLHHTHTLEDIDIVYRIGDVYQPEAIAQLDYFLRDHRTFDLKPFDPREFDLLHDILIRLNRPDASIDIVCGYRSQWSNDLLRASSRGVAEHSQHMLGHAIDIQVPGASTERLRDAALSLNEGGVGYYPVSHFVHVDVGAIRTWTYSPRRARRRGHLRPAGHRPAPRHRHITHATGA